MNNVKKDLKKIVDGNFEWFASDVDKVFAKALLMIFEVLEQPNNYYKSPPYSDVDVVKEVHRVGKLRKG